MWGMEGKLVRKVELMRMYELGFETSNLDWIDWVLLMFLHISWKPLCFQFYSKLSKHYPHHITHTLLLQPKLFLIECYHFEKLFQYMQVINVQPFLKLSCTWLKNRNNHHRFVVPKVIFGLMLFFCWYLWYR